jgi:hypothetical protein
MGYNKLIFVKPGIVFVCPTSLARVMGISNFVLK